MVQVTVLYFSPVSTSIKRTSDTFIIPDNGMKLSTLAKHVVARYPNSGIEECRWSMDGDMVYKLDSFVLKGGEAVTLIPLLTEG